MTDTQPYQFESEEPLEDEDDSYCFKKKAKSSKKAWGEPGTLTGVYVNSGAWTAQPQKKICKLIY